MHIKSAGSHFIIALFFCTSTNLQAQTTAPEITIEMNETSDDSEFSMKIDTSMLGAFSLQAPRSMGGNDKPTFNCKLGSQSNIITLEDSIRCDSVEWQIGFQPVSHQGLDIAEQSNRYSTEESWYFLSEWQSIPTVLINNKRLPAKVCLPNNVASCFDVPKHSQAPLLAAWGLSSVPVELDGHQFNIQSDVKAILDNREQWLPTFKEQLQYLSTLFEHTDKIDWQMNLFSREIESGRISGAAGFQAVNVNVPITNGGIDPATYKHMLKILAHEVIHGFDTREQHLWISEGLAEYYAQKSLKSTNFSHRDAQEQWVSMSMKLPFAKVGLVEANRSLVEQNQQHFQMLFYTKSVSFWSELDSALAAQKSSLDELITIQLSGDEYQLSEEFVTSVVEILGLEEWSKLTGKYLL